MTEDNVEVSVLGKDGGFKVGGMTRLCSPLLLLAHFFCAARYFNYLLISDPAGAVKSGSAGLPF